MLNNEMPINPLNRISPAPPGSAKPRVDGNEARNAASVPGPADRVASSTSAGGAGKRPVTFSPLMVEGELVRLAGHENNSPVLGHARLNGKKRQVVFKQEVNRNENRQTVLNNHIKAVVASRIMDKFGIPTVQYYPAKMKMETGAAKEGIISEYVNCKNLFEDPSLIERITNPDEAVAGSIVNAWLGDWDRILNHGNVWVQPDGKVIFGDFGYAFKRKVTCLGLPKANLLVMQRYATRENVEPTVNKITSLTDEEIGKIVDDAGRGVHGWNKEVAGQIKEILINNRNELKEKNPFSVFYEKTPSGLSVEIEHRVMVLLKNHVKQVAAMSDPPGGSSPDEDGPYFLGVRDKRNRLSSIHQVDSSVVSRKEREEQRRIRKAISSLADGIWDWNKDTENLLMVWILFHDPKAEEYFQSSPDHFYPLLKFMRNLFTAEDILGQSLGIS